MPHATISTRPGRAGQSSAFQLLLRHLHVLLLPDTMHSLKGTFMPRMGHEDSLTRPGSRFGEGVRAGGPLFARPQRLPRIKQLESRYFSSVVFVGYPSFARCPRPLAMAAAGKTPRRRYDFLHRLTGVIVCQVLGVGVQRATSGPDVRRIQERPWWGGPAGGLLARDGRDQHACGGVRFFGRTHSSREAYPAICLRW